MPALTCPVTELTTHVFGPVCQQLAHRILAALNYEDVVGDQIYINTDWSTHSVTGDANDNANLGQTRFSVEVNLQLNPTSQKWDVYSFYHTAAYGLGKFTRNRNEPIFYDPYNQIKIFEMITPVTIVLNCELVLASAELAFQTPQQIFNDYANGSVMHYNDLVYDYPVPKPICSVLFGIWEKDRLFGKDAGIAFDQYIKNRTNNKWNLHKQRDADEFELVVPSYHLETLGSLEYSDDKPQGVMEGKLPVAWSIPFVYTVQFGMQSILVMDYPCVVSNQLLPDIYIPRDKNNRFNKIEPEGRNTYPVGDYEKSLKLNQGVSKLYSQTPWYDDWSVMTANTLSENFQAIFLITHILVDEDKTKDYATEIDLNDDFDPSFKLKTAIKALLNIEGSEAVDRQSPICIALFRDDKELDPHTDYSIDENLKLHFRAQELYYHYRIVWTMCTDIYHIKPKWYKYLVRYFDGLPDTLKSQIVDRMSNGDWSEYTKDFSRTPVTVDSDGYIHTTKPPRKLLITDAEAIGLPTTNQISTARDPDKDYFGLNDFNKKHQDLAPTKLDDKYLHVSDINWVEYTSNPDSINANNNSFKVIVTVDETTGKQYLPGEILPNETTSGGSGSSGGGGSSSGGSSGDDSILEKKEVYLSEPEGISNANYIYSRIDRFDILARNSRSS